MTKRLWCTGAAAVGLCSAVLLTGCGNFFVDPTSTTTPTTGSATGSYAYAVNTNNSLSEFDLGAGKLTAVTGSPVTLTTGLGAASVTVSRANSFVFVGGNGAIECYSIGSTGALTQLTAGGGTATANFVSLETSPDGNWLFGLDAIQPGAPNLYVFAINAATGALTLAGSAGVPLPVPGPAAAVARMVKISPNAAFVGVALGGGGDVFFTFNTTTGVLTQSGLLKTNGYDDDAILFDSNSAYAYVGRYGLTAGNSVIASYTVSTAGALTGVGTKASGDTPFSLAFDNTGGFLYSANRGSSSLSAYSIATGVLTELASSPYPSGTSVSAVARDSSGSYLIAAAAGGTSDLTLYAFDVLTAGKLAAVATSANGSGTAGSIAVATTHSTTASF